MITGLHRGYSRAHLVVFPQQVKVLLRGGDEGAAHGVRDHDEALQAHAHVVPAALVVPAGPGRGSGERESGEWGAGSGEGEGEGDFVSKHRRKHGCAGATRCLRGHKKGAHKEDGQVSVVRALQMGLTTWGSHRGTQGHSLEGQVSVVRAHNMGHTWGTHSKDRYLSSGHSKWGSHRGTQGAPRGTQGHTQGHTGALTRRTGICRGAARGAA